MSYTTEQIALQTTVWNYCRNKGIPETATAGIMGNISAESSWNVNSIEEGNSIGFGLFQWSFSRRTQLESYGTDLQHQLEFFYSELTGENLNVTGADLQWFNANSYTYDNFISGNYNANESASAFCWCWERPNVDLAHENLRQSEAVTFLSQFTGTTGGGDNGSGEENPPPEGDIKLKNYHLYGATDKLYGRKFIPQNKSFTLVSIMGDIATIKDGERQYKVPKKHII
jgi:hypothetical protein